MMLRGKRGRAEITPLGKACEDPCFVTGKNKPDPKWDLFNFRILLLLLLKLPIAWNTQDSPFSRIWLLRNHIDFFSTHIEIKSCRTEDNICLAGGLQEQQVLTYVNSSKNKEFQHQEVCNQTCAFLTWPFEILCHLMPGVDSLEKILMLGKIRGRRRGK